jgi:hypothetical protein
LGNVLGLSVDRFGFYLQAEVNLCIGRTGLVVIAASSRGVLDYGLLVYDLPELQLVRDVVVLVDEAIALTALVAVATCFAG